MKYFEYISPLHTELKELGYGIHINPSDTDIFLTKQILNSSLCELNMFVPMLEEYHIRDISKPAIRVYSYYINNPQQFNRNPNNIVGSMLKHILNAACSILKNLYKTNITEYIRARPMILRRFSEQMKTVYYESAVDLAERVKHNTLIEREGLNADNRIIESLFH